MVGPLGLGVLVLFKNGGVLGVLGLVVVSGVCLVSSLPGEVVGVSLLLCPFFHFALLPFPLFLGLCGGLMGGVGAQVLGRGWGSPLCFEVFPFLLFL